MNLAVSFRARGKPRQAITSRQRRLNFGSTVADATQNLNRVSFRALKYTAKFICHYAAEELRKTNLCATVQILKTIFDFGKYQSHMRTQPDFAF